MNDVKYQLPRFLARGLQFSWQNGEELANWTGTFNFTDDGAVKSGSDTGTRYQHPREWLQRSLSLFVWTTNVSTGWMKNEIYSLLWLLGTAPHDTEDARGAQMLCCFPPSRPGGHFGICHKHPCLSPVSIPPPMPRINTWQCETVGLGWGTSQHDSIDARRARWRMWPKAFLIIEFYVF